MKKLLSFFCLPRRKGITKNFLYPHVKNAVLTHGSMVLITKHKPDNIVKMFAAEGIEVTCEAEYKKCYKGGTFTLDRTIQVGYKIMKKDETCVEFCGTNYCDENGCMNRTRHLVHPPAINVDSAVEKEWAFDPEQASISS